MAPTTKRMPTIFIGHGSPSFFVEELATNPILMEFSKDSENYNSLVRTPKQINAEKPAAIVIISAHWDSAKVQISAAEKSSLYYDFGGFPKAVYEITYPAPTNPQLSRQISDLLTSHGVQNELDTKRGWDHGVFLPLKLMFPEASIPVISVSLHRSMDAKTHLIIGKALAPLREQGVLIIGSGAIIHDFNATETNTNFVNAVDHAITMIPPSEREKAFENWRDFKGQGHDRTGTAHFIPLLVVVGASGEDKGTVAFRRDALGGRLINCNYCFGL